MGKDSVIMNRKCPICGNDAGRVLKHISMNLQDGCGLPDSYDVVCCAECGFAYADVDASQEIYDEYYKNYNVYAENNSLKQKGTQRTGEYERIYELIISKAGYEAKILDIGCGGGDFLAYLKEKGFKNLYGMDPSQNSIDKLMVKGIKGICHGIFEPINTADVSSYDIVVSMGVIEHIYDLPNYLTQIVRYMKEDGCLLLEAPAVEGFAEVMWAIPNYFNHEHINYFSKMSLDKLLSNFSLSRKNENVYYECENREKVLIAIYERKNREKSCFHYDDLSEKSIQSYFEAIRISEAELKGKINKLLNSDRRLVIWGCGSYAMWIVKQYPKLVEKVDCFIDNNTAKQETCVCGKRVFGPSYLINADDVTIVICSMENAFDIEKQALDLVPDCRTVIL